MLHPANNHVWPDAWNTVNLRRSPELHSWEFLLGSHYLGMVDWLIYQVVQGGLSWVTFIIFKLDDNYNILMVFAIHQYESAIGIHVSPPSWTPSNLPPQPLHLVPQVWGGAPELAFPQVPRWWWCWPGPLWSPFWPLSISVYCLHPLPASGVVDLFHFWSFPLELFPVCACFLALSPEEAVFPRFHTRAPTQASHLLLCLLLSSPTVPAAPGLSCPFYICVVWSSPTEQWPSALPKGLNHQGSSKRCWWPVPY